MRFSGKLRYVIIGLSVFGVVLFQSCSKDEDIEPEKKNYELIAELSVDASKGLFILLGQADLANSSIYDVNVYKYNYSVTYRGKDINASGLLCVPNAPGKEFPVMSFQHGTLVAHSEAPSIDYNNLLNKGIEAVASMGYVVLIPDEIGFGASSDLFHPYLVKEPIANSVIEMINSIKEYQDGEFAGASINDSLFLMGYSHGGWATMATLESMEQTNQNNWNIIGVACGAGPYSPEIVKDFSLSSIEYGQQYYMSYVFLSFKDGGLISNDLSDFYQEPYASTIPDLFDGLNTGNDINTKLNSVNTELYTNEYLNTYPSGKYTDLQKVLNENSIPAWQTSTPILLLHGEIDNSIPIEVSESMYNDFILQGANNVSFEKISKVNHVGGAIPSLARTLLWFQSFR